MAWDFLLKPLSGLISPVFSAFTADFREKSNRLKQSLENSLTEIKKLENGNCSVGPVAQFLRQNYHHENQSARILAFEDCISQVDKSDYRNVSQILRNCIGRLNAGQYIDESDEQLIRNEIEPALTNLLKFTSLPRKVINSIGWQICK